ncbi:MAG: hypothetical protein CVT73_05535 [Alphaproteobacteria bacterium HGW-Alphaproteobacteria-12]|nr:MAG: hypothetical protein CVT73_05535 [Alphaproteobacteria bacterium HGW-Alphaproteobacteria-12]
MDRVDYESVVIQDILNWIKAEEIDLEPWYQRRSVWLTPQKSFLINTIFEQKPVPTLYIRHRLDLERERSMKEVVDGQQRIRAIVAFVSGEISARHPQKTKRVAYGSLSSSEKERFLMTKLSVGYLIGADEKDVIDIFGRINSVAKTLNEQEKRNAKYSGEFKQFCLKEASERLPFWRENRIFSANDIARMQEVQFISDLILNLESGLSDYSSAKLNRIYQQFDEDYPSWKVMGERLESVFSLLSSLHPGVIPDSIFRRPPLLFSLIMALDDVGKVSEKNLNSVIKKIDSRFNTDIPVSERPKKDANFAIAATSSTQRIASRRIRHSYIKSYLA